MRAVSGATSPDHQLRRLDAAILLLVGLLALASLVVWLDPRFGLSNARAVDVAINVSATLVGGALAGLAWVRWLERREAVNLYTSAAFCALTVVNALILGAILLGRRAEFGLSADAPGEAPIYLWTLTRFSAALFLVVGPLRTLLGRQSPLHPAAVMLGVPMALIAIAAGLIVAEPVLPPVATPPELVPGGAASTPVGFAFGAIQVLVFGLFIFGAILFRRLYVRDRLVSYGFLSVGLVLAAFSQLHFAVDPRVAYGVVTTSDVLRLAFHAVLLVGIETEIEGDLRALRRANRELRRLREVDASIAALAERTRLAREIHDGLAQDLWFAKLKQGGVEQAEELKDSTRAVVREVLGSIDAALADARQAVMALRIDPNSGGGLVTVLKSYVEDFGDRYGVLAEFSADPEVPRLAPRVEAELLRIVQEALNNTRKHADATLVRVNATCADGRVRVAVADNGRGFDPRAVADSRFGLRGMRERADVIGARLEIDSRPQDGTRVLVELPSGANL